MPPAVCVCVGDFFFFQWNLEGEKSHFTLVFCLSHFSSLHSPPISPRSDDLLNYELGDDIDDQALLGADEDELLLSDEG